MDQRREHSAMRPDYHALGDYLRALPAETREVTLTFAQIEKIVGAPLPPSHINYREWWANQTDTTRRAQARAWKNAGFHVETVRLAPDGSVTFRRR